MRHQLRLDLVAQLIHHFVSRSDKFDAGIFALLCKITVFRKESIARVNGIRTFRLGQIDNLIDAQIDVYRSLALTNLIRFVCLCPEESIFIFLRIDCNRPDAQFTAGSEYSDGNLASVCHEDFFKFLHFILSPTCHK